MSENVLELEDLWALLEEAFELSRKVKKLEAEVARQRERIWELEDAAREREARRSDRPFRGSP